jgi:hypothetical protein
MPCPCNKNKLLDSAAIMTQQAAARGAVALDRAVERLQPLVNEAATRARPYADQAAARARQAGVKAAGQAADNLERLQPSVNAALDRVAPAVDRAQRAVQDDLLPRLVGALRQAGAEAPVATVVVPEPAKKGVFGKVVKFAAIGTIIGAAVVAAKNFLSAKDDTWAAYEPHEPYVYPDDVAASPADSEDDQTIVSDLSAENLTESVSDAVDDAFSGSEPNAEELSPFRFGEGSFVGDNPPEGYYIKGNERSMKYHTPDSPMYDVTTPEVWFSSEEAAQGAGFSPANH